MTDAHEPKRGCLAAFAPIIRFVDRVIAGESGVASRNEPPAVIVNKRFLSPAERAFFHTLHRAVGDRGYVLAQVSLQQLLFFTERAPRGSSPEAKAVRSNLQTWRNKVQNKSIDFVICKLDTMQPVVAFELDDKSHATPKRQSRDDDVHAVLEKAGLPLLRTNAGTVNVKELHSLFTSYLK